MKVNNRNKAKIMNCLSNQIKTKLSINQVQINKTKKTCRNIKLKFPNNL